MYTFLCVFTFLYPVDTFHSVYTFLYPVDAKNSELVCIHLFWQICPNASIGKNSSENLWKPLKSDNICLPLSARSWIFWIGLDWSTLLLFWEIAAKLCFCTNATSSNYFRTHQFGRQEVVWENLSPFFLFCCCKYQGIIYHYIYRFIF